MNLQQLKSDPADVNDAAKEVLNLLATFSAEFQNKVLNTVMLSLQKNRIEYLAQIKIQADLVESTMSFLQKAANKE